MKIERGIITAHVDNEDVYVRCVGALYKLKAESLFERDYKNGEPVLGVIIDKKYILCQNFELKTAEKFFGYIISNGFASTAIRVQLIENFDKEKYDSYKVDQDYTLGEELVLQKDNILSFFNENETA